MGVDISHIVRNDFQDVYDSEAARKFVMETIDRLKKALLIQGDEIDFEYRYEIDYKISFRFPMDSSYDMEFELQNGFWQIESYYHYCHIVMHEGDYFWLRRQIYDVAKALGQEEAWHAEEFYTWNGGICQSPGVTFEEWIESVVTRCGKDFPEYDQASIMAQGDKTFPKYEPVYHDSFKECNELFEKLQGQLEGYKLLGLHRVAGLYLRCEKDGKIYHINENTMELLSDDPVDDIEYGLNGPEFVVKKKGLSAVYDKDGNQMTDFVKGEFMWKLSGPKKCRHRVIYNEEAGIEIEREIVIV